MRFGGSALTMFAFDPLSGVVVPISAQLNW